MTPELRELAMKWDINGRWVGIDHAVAQGLLDVAGRAEDHLLADWDCVDMEELQTLSLSPEGMELRKALRRLREVSS